MILSQKNANYLSKKFHSCFHPPHSLQTQDLHEEIPKPLSSSYTIAYRQRHHYHKKAHHPHLSSTSSNLEDSPAEFFFPLAMDWCSWLSKSNLHPILAQEYGLLFSHNELEEEDIEHLDHDLLLSMGISVGKHRLEILKLARKERKGIPAAMKKFSKRAKECVQKFARGSSSAIVAVPKAAGGRWRGRNNRRLLTAKPDRLMITNGTTAIHDSSEGESGAIVEVRWDSMFQGLNPT